MSRRADLVSNRRAGSFDTTNDHAQGCDLARWQTVDGHDNGQKRRGGNLSTTSSWPKNSNEKAYGHAVSERWPRCYDPRRHEPHASLMILRRKRLRWLGTLTEGVHQIEIRKEGYGSYARTIDVYRGRVSTLTWA